MVRHRADPAEYHETISPFFTGLVIAAALAIALMGLLAVAFAW